MEEEQEEEEEAQEFKHENDHRLLFSSIFGDSDSEESEDWLYGSPHHTNERWESVEHVDGLWRCNHFLSPNQQQRILKAIETDCGVFLYLWWTQAMRFGRLPDWALELSSQIHNSVLKFKSMDSKCSTKTDPISSPSMAAQSQCPLPEDILLREPLFDQMIANSYEPGEGITAHVDLLRFEDGIAIVSLLSPCVMCFRSVPDPLCSYPNKVNGHINEDNQLNDTGAKVQILLSPGDLIVMSGTARYKWTHEINRNKDQQVWQGEALKQERRISVTLRRLCPQLVLGD
ncbi:unnamed protein product [Sphagnum jensenii]|uniref:Fe2OG dioxygenase domain-containing protein n=1 Tax=Sphagnum jensenii TaxID=128206 RepID=A0ABP1B1X4_9BRYO